MRYDKPLLFLSCIAAFLHSLCVHHCLDKLGAVILGILRYGFQHISNQCQNYFRIDRVLCSAEYPNRHFGVEY